MKRAKLITTEQGYRVVKQIEGSGNRYLAGRGELTDIVNVRPATKKDLDEALDLMGISMSNSVPKELYNKVVMELSKYPQTRIGIGNGSYEGTTHNRWVYEKQSNEDKELEEYLEDIDKFFDTLD